MTSKVLNPSWNGRRVYNERAVLRQAHVADDGRPSARIAVGSFMKARFLEHPHASHLVAVATRRYFHSYTSRLTHAGDSLTHVSHMRRPVLRNERTTDSRLSIVVERITAVGSLCQTYITYLGSETGDTNRTLSLDNKFGRY